MNLVKLYGLNHSGSHYLAWLLDNNFKDIVILHSHTGWNHGPIIDSFNWDSTDWNTDPFLRNKEKHGDILKREPLNTGKPVTEYEELIYKSYISKELPMLILVRSPYDWIYSYNITHNRIEKKQSDLEYAAKRWSDINRNYFEHSWPKKHIIKYESLRDNTQHEINKISEFLGIQRNEIFIDSNQDMVKLANVWSDARKIPKFRTAGGYEKCKNGHIENQKITAEEFDEIVCNNIDEDVLNFYNNL